MSQSRPERREFHDRPWLRRGPTLWRLVGSGILLVWLFHLVSWSDLVKGFRQANWLLLAVAVVLAPLGVALRAYRWYLLLPQSMRTATTWWRVHALTYVGSALNVVMPANSGDLARGALGALKFGSSEAYLATGLMDKWLGLWSLCLIGTGIALVSRLWSVAASLGGATLLGWGVFISLRWLPWHWGARCWQRLTKGQLDLPRFREQFRLPPSGWVQLLTVSFSVWILSFAQFGLLTAAVRLASWHEIPWLLFPLMLIARLFPLAFNGLGGQEWAAAWASRYFGLDAAAGVLLSLLVTVTLTAVPALIGLGFLWRWEGVQG